MENLPYIPVTPSVPRSTTYLKCAGCEYPMCSTECAARRVRHTEAECEVLSRCPDSERPKILRVGADNTYSIITPLRMLLMSDTNCDSWKRSNQLMDHLDGIPLIKKCLSTFGKNILTCFRTSWADRRVAVVPDNSSGLLSKSVGAETHTRTDTSGHRPPQCQRCQAAVSQDPLPPD